MFADCYGDGPKPYVRSVASKRSAATNGPVATNGSVASSPAPSAVVRSTAAPETTATVKAGVGSVASVDPQSVTAELIKREVLAAIAKVKNPARGPFRVTVHGVPCDITSDSIREGLEQECGKLHLTYDGDLSKMIVQFMPSQCHEIGGAGLGKLVDINLAVMDMNLFEGLMTFNATSK
jgi:hypothetical protein